ncbi:hypothetical protein LMH87_006307 [Akanthomyces muscarius]|uniref:Uncharacterized protein n=1 Tax=Akanthomyces muscarius TaxID=2231603 RepID=A0A9W8QQK1_AKAMU|nr:hypothetical protein LMH87_006307 [Akanthomyces muscarius]KAJ4164644.1 hypothetical protein LMH87_006307 [Akanthomyces muscarius]
MRLPVADDGSGYLSTPKALTPPAAGLPSRGPHPPSCVLASHLVFPAIARLPSVSLPPIAPTVPLPSRTRQQSASFQKKKKHPEPALISSGVSSRWRKHPLGLLFHLPVTGTPTDSSGVGLCITLPPSLIALQLSATPSTCRDTLL